MAQRVPSVSVDYFLSSAERIKYLRNELEQTEQELARHEAKAADARSRIDAMRAEISGRAEEMESAVRAKVLEPLIIRPATPLPPPGPGPDDPGPPPSPDPEPAPEADPTGYYVYFSGEPGNRVYAVSMIPSYGEAYASYVGTGEMGGIDYYDGTVWRYDVKE